MHETNGEILQFIDDLGFNSDHVTGWDAVQSGAHEGGVDADAYYIILWRGAATRGDRVIVHRVDFRTYSDARDLIGNI